MKYMTLFMSKNNRLYRFYVSSGKGALLDEDLLDFDLGNMRGSYRKWKLNFE